MNSPYVLIDTAALEHNAAALKSRAGDFYCVLKCDAYGHGASKCAAHLYAAGMRRFAVYSIKEAKKIRTEVGNSEILILGVTDPRLAGELEAEGFIQTVGSFEYASALASRSKKVKIHTEIDCGMNRSGFKAWELSQIDLPFPMENTLGVFAHLSCADERSLCSAKKQAHTFRLAADKLEANLGKTLTRHLCASAGSLRSELKTGVLSRIGLALYGIAPENCDGAFLKPVMSFYSSVTDVRQVKKGETVGYGLDHSVNRDSIIATVSGGYANGIHRVCGGKLTVLINGEKAISVGRICMDRFMVDVTDIVALGKSVRPGDTVTFFDKDFGIESMARACKTIPYEILTSVGSQNRRVYTNGSRP